MNVTISSGSIGGNIRIGRAITLIFLAVLCMHASVLAKRKDDVVLSIWRRRKRRRAALFRRDRK
jgi:hypothetical protein